MSPIDLAPPAILAPAPNLWTPAKPFIIRASEEDHAAVKAMPFMAAIAGGARRGARTLWTPTELSTQPSGWYDAELSSKTLSGSEVSQWNDLSSNARHATQGTSANRPVYSSMDKWLTFDGTNDFFSVSSSLIAGGNANWTICAVVRPNTVSGSRTIYFQGNTVANQAPHCGFLNAAHSMGFYSSTLSGGTVSSGTWYINSYRYNGSTREIFSNGVSVASGSYTSANGGTSNAFIGKHNEGGGANFLSGNLRTLIAFRSALSTDDREKVEGYLAHLWGLQGSLDSGHPYKSNPPYKD